MNIMIISPGRRVEIVNYFKKEVHKNGGKVYTLDISELAPALYSGDEHFIIEKDFNDLSKYIDQVISICEQFNIKYILSLIDPELELLSSNKEKFLQKGIVPIVSDEEVIYNTFDKYKFYTNYKNILSLLKTYYGYNEVVEALKKKEVKFPLFAKIRTGSGSAGIGKVNSEEELKFYEHKENYIFQPLKKYKEYGVDVYFDMISGKIVSLFIKEKISMRAGETDKAVSLFREDIVQEIMKLEKIEGFKGNIDVDVFEDKEGKLYINEINPRFGGGYPHAYNCGVDFIKKIINNLSGLENRNDIGNYNSGVIMMKYNNLMFKYKDEIF